MISHSLLMRSPDVSLKAVLTLECRCRWRCRQELEEHGHRGAARRLRPRQHDSGGPPRQLAPRVLLPPPFVSVATRRYLRLVLLRRTLLHHARCCPRCASRAADTCICSCYFLSLLLILTSHAHTRSCHQSDTAYLVVFIRVTYLVCLQHVNQYNKTYGRCPSRLVTLAADLCAACLPLIRVLLVDTLARCVVSTTNCTDVRTKPDAIECLTASHQIC